MKLSKSSNYDNFATIKNQTTCRGNRRCVVMVTELGWEFTNIKETVYWMWKGQPFLSMVILEMSRTNYCEFMPICARILSKETTIIKRVVSYMYMNVMSGPKSTSTCSRPQSYWPVFFPSFVLLLRGWNLRIAWPQDKLVLQKSHKILSSFVKQNTDFYIKLFLHLIAFEIKWSVSLS